MFMKIADLTQSVVEDGRTTSSIKVSASSVAWITSIITAIVSLIPALVQIGTFWLVDLPKSEDALAMKNREFQIDLLQRALQIDDEADRRNSLLLLLQAGLLEDENGALKLFAQDTTRPIPKWDKDALTGQGPTSESEERSVVLDPTP